MAFNTFSYTKTWTSSTDFPTIETNETQVRADMQSLYTEIATGLNGVINNIETSLGNTNDKIPTSKAVNTAIAAVEAQIPTIPANNVTGSGTSGYLAAFSGTNTITSGAKLTISSSSPTGGNNGDIWIKY